MKKALLALTMLALANVATATSVDVASTGGVLTGSTSGLKLGLSTMVLFDISGQPPLVGNLGEITFFTSSLALGSLASSAVFNSGGAFEITGNGTMGIHLGPIFTGTFDGPVLWQIITLGNGTHQYQITGTLSGKWFNGSSVTGAFVGLTNNIGKGVFHNGQSVGFASMNVNLNGGGITRSVVPEPSSFLFMGTGLSALGFYARKFGLRR